MEINGLPLHPLVVHAAVVFGPLAALAGLLYALVPRWQERLRWPMVVLVVVATVSIWVAFLSGEDFRDSERFAAASGEFAERLEDHEELAEKLRLVTSGFAVVAFLAAWWHTRTGPVRYVLAALLAVGAVATLVLTVLTGDAGAKATWG